MFVCPGEGIEIGRDRAPRRRRLDSTHVADVARVMEIESGHDAIINRPAELADASCALKARFGWTKSHSHA